ncbi:hypothetical protein TSUD_37490 [Trifolium subterraneum]|uniref:Uncharacterized protein n=1 Tax=Trifolium subterraneum TaxID=3900 RepID=A0A2Z6LXL1_TRISU|nr:hypothetical protein TSUD_37490 [Trifolium subterraneum]
MLYARYKHARSVELFLIEAFGKWGQVRIYICRLTFIVDLASYIPMLQKDFCLQPNRGLTYRCPIN